MKDKKLTPVRARSVLIGEVFKPAGKVTEKMDEGELTGATASTVLDVIEEAKDVGKDRMLRVAEVVKMVGLSKTIIYRRITAKTFPAPLPLKGMGHANAVGWRKSKIMKWIRELEANRK